MERKENELIGIIESNRAISTLAAMNMYLQERDS